MTSVPSAEPRRRLVKECFDLGRATPLPGDMEPTEMPIPFASPMQPTATGMLFCDGGGVIVEQTTLPKVCLSCFQPWLLSFSMPSRSLARPASREAPVAARIALTFTIPCSPSPHAARQGLALLWPGGEHRGGLPTLAGLRAGHARNIVGGQQRTSLDGARLPCPTAARNTPHHNQDTDNEQCTHGPPPSLAVGASVTPPRDPGNRPVDVSSPRASARGSSAVIPSACSEWPPSGRE